MQLETYLRMHTSVEKESNRRILGPDSHFLPLVEIFKGVGTC